MATIVWRFTTSPTAEIKPPTQRQDVKDVLYEFFAYFFDGESHLVSEQTITFPDCYVRISRDMLPQDANDTLDKTLITILPAPSKGETSAWKYASDSFVRRQELAFNIYVTTPHSIGGQLATDKVTSLIQALIGSAQSRELRIAGLAFPKVSSPTEISFNDQLATNLITLRCQLSMEYV